MKKRYVFLPENNELKYFNEYKTNNENEEKDFLSDFRERAYYKNKIIKTPFGKKTLSYFDFTASGCFFEDIEEELCEKVLPFMSNTHTRSNSTSTIITHFFEHAYARINQYVNANEDDVTIFTGFGSTSAVNRLIGVMGIRIPEQLERKYKLSKSIPEKDRPVIFRSMMEHHSNDIPWRETIGIDVYIDFDENGRISLEDLEKKLDMYKDYPFKIGTFSAGSNVTGILSNVYDISKILHKNGAYAFFDYAAAGPYVKIDMHPENENDSDAKYAYIDAIFISTHKFVGGPRTPGILIANKELFTNTVPFEPGGGTVLYTSPWDHKYLGNISHREMGGTPAIVQTIQAGLTFDLKEIVGHKRIKKIEDCYLKKALKCFKNIKNLKILGEIEENNLGIISVMFENLHHNLAVNLFNDLFGIQVRGGCMCAGPYGHKLLNIEQDLSEEITCKISEGIIAIKPGWVRISFNHITSDEEFDKMLEAVEYIALKGKKYEDKYKMINESGEFEYIG